MLNPLKWFNPEQQEEFKEGAAYACEHGSYCGTFFILTEKSSDTLSFLIIPSLEVVKLPTATVKDGIEKKVLVFVEQLPDNVFKVCSAQFKKLKENEKPDNRHKQSTLPNLLHRKVRGPKSAGRDRKIRLSGKAVRELRDGVD